jgi:hypothetical protein
MIDAPSGSVPVDTVVEVAGHDARPLDEEVSVFGESPSQRAELVFPEDAAAGILGPHCQ